MKGSYAVAAFGFVFAVFVYARDPANAWGAGCILLAFCCLPAVFALQARYQLRTLDKISPRPAVTVERKITISELGSAGEVAATPLDSSRRRFPYSRGLRDRET